MYVSGLAFAAFIAGVAAQNMTRMWNSSRTSTSRSSITLPRTVDVFLPGGIYQGAFGASVIGADACGTTLALSCSLYYYCEGFNDEITVTQGPSDLQSTYFVTVSGVIGTVTESCGLTSGSQGLSSSASCRVTVKAEVRGKSTSTTTYEYLTAEPVTVNYGASLLAQATGTCTTSSAGAEPTVAVIKQVYKVIVPVGIAMVALI